MDLFFVTKEKLKQLIRKMEEDISSFVKNPQKDFTRNRKISFSDVLHFLVSMRGQSLDKEILSAYSYSTDTPTSSAMIQARSKLNTNAMEYLFHTFTSASPTGSCFHGYQLLAVDGSKFTVPENEQEPLYRVKIPNTDRNKNVLHLNALYHLDSGIFEDVYFQGIHELNEHQALTLMLQRSNIKEKFIIVGDRGYESYNTFAHVESRGGNYVIRGRLGAGGIFSGLELPDDEEFDLECSIIICQKHTRETRLNPTLYKRIRSDAKFDFFTEDSSEYLLRFRVVKIKISERLTEILFTNLPKETFSAEELKEIYHMRWEVETAFLHLKYALGAVAVHSKKSEFIIQELYAKVLMFNFCKIVIRHVSVPDNGRRKYSYRLNIKMAMEICIYFWRSPKGTAPPNIGEMLLRYIVPTREHRTTDRVAHAKPDIHFNYRIS